MNRNRFCRAALLLLLSLWCGLSGLQVSAAEVSGLYRATTLVDSRNDERERQRAFGVAMRKVLVKLSGRTDTLDETLVSRALRQPQDYVEAWAYRSLQDDAAANGTAGDIEIEVSFFRSEIRSLLDSAGVPIWPQNRPDTLLWVVEQDAGGRRSLLGTAGSDPQVLQLLQQIAADKGVPLIRPILDLQDQMSLRPDALWNFDVAAITEASRRYQAESVLAIRLYQAFGGELIARTEHIFRGQVLELDAEGRNLETFLEDSVAMLARELAANYAIRLSGSSGDSEVSLWVEGVGGIEAYAGMLNYLRTLAVVKDVQVRQVSGSIVELQLDTGGQLRQLIESIALDNKLLPLAEPQRRDRQVSLRYQWQRS